MTDKTAEVTETELEPSREKITRIRWYAAVDRNGSILQQIRFTDNFSDEKLLAFALEALSKRADYVQPYVGLEVTGEVDGLKVTGHGRRPFKGPYFINPQAEYTTEEEVRANAPGSLDQFKAGGTIIRARSGTLHNYMHYGAISVNPPSEQGLPPKAVIVKRP